MKLNHLIAAIGSIVLVPHLARADGFVEATVSSRYVFRGLKAAEFTVHPAAELAAGNFYGGVWAALPLEGKGAPDRFLEEYDFYVGHGWALSDKVGLDVGATRYTYSGADDSTEAYVGFFAELGTVNPSLYLYNDFDLDTTTVEATATAAVPLQGFPFEATARLGRVEGDDDYTYYGLDLVYPIALSDLAKLSLGLHYSGNDFGAAQPDDHLYASAAVRLSF